MNQSNVSADLGAVPLSEVLASLRMAPSTFYSHVQSGLMPKPFRIGKRSYLDLAETKAAIAAIKARASGKEAA